MSEPKRYERFKGESFRKYKARLGREATSLMAFLKDRYVGVRTVCAFDSAGRIQIQRLGLWISNQRIVSKADKDTQ